MNLHHEMQRAVNDFAPPAPDASLDVMRRVRQRARRRTVTTAVSALGAFAIVGALAFRAIAPTAVEPALPATVPDEAIAFTHALGWGDSPMQVIRAPEATEILTLLPKGLDMNLESGSLSPDGSTVAFSRVDDEAPGRPEYLVTMPTGLGPEHILFTSRLPSVAITKTSWTPDGTHVGFVYVEMKPGPKGDWDGTSDVSRVWTVPIDGSSDPAPIETIPREWLVNSFAWSPDGSKVVVEAHDRNDLIHDEPPTLRIVDLTTGDITSTSVEGKHPAWSPEGSTISFTRFTDPDQPRTQILTMDVTTHEVTYLTPVSNGRDWSSTWSSDGSTVAYLHVEDGKDTCELNTIPGGGGEPTHWVQQVQPDYGGSFCASPVAWMDPAALTDLIDETSADEVNDLLIPFEVRIAAAEYWLTPTYGMPEGCERYVEVVEPIDGPEIGYCLNGFDPGAGREVALELRRLAMQTQGAHPRD